MHKNYKGTKGILGTIGTIGTKGTIDTIGTISTIDTIGTKGTIGAIGTISTKGTTNYPIPISELVKSTANTECLSCLQACLQRPFISSVPTRFYWVPHVGALTRSMRKLTQ